MGKKLWRIWFPLVCAVAYAPLAEATLVCPLVTFNGDVSGLNLCVQIDDGGTDLVDFVFYNQSIIDSAIARIYFDDDVGVLSSIAAIKGEGISFVQPASPGNLPAGRTLAPPFDAIERFSLAAAPPLPRNGINPGEWATVTFDLAGDFGLGDVVGALNDNLLRVGVHVIALPDGRSVSAVSIPAPATVALIGLGAILLRGRRQKTNTRNRKFAHCGFLAQVFLGLNF